MRKRNKGPACPAVWILAFGSWLSNLSVQIPPFGSNQDKPGSAAVVRRVLRMRA
jgi:hypothetical protein